MRLDKEENEDKDDQSVADDHIAINLSCIEKRRGDHPARNDCS